MKRRLDQLHKFLQQHEHGGVVVLFFLFTLLFGGFAVFKFFRFGYDVLDLAIYDQVMQFMLRGEWFQLTIHPGSYLGDHFEPVLLALFPFYALAPHPITLLLLQTLAVGASVFPLARLTRRHLSSPIVLLAGFWFLFNPITQHLTLFEFHALPFALPLIFWALVFYEEKKWRAFFLTLLLSLTVREDVSLFWIFFSLFALIQRRSLAWTWLPLLTSIAWFIVAIKLIAFFNPDETYKFFSYYQKLGTSIPNILTNLVAHPDLWLGQLFRVQNIAYVLMVLIFSFGLPLFSLSALLPLLPILGQLFLSGFGGGEVTLFSHYSTLILPALFFSSLFSLRYWSKTPNPNAKVFFPRLADRLTRMNRDFPALIPIVVGTIMIYSISTIAPFPTMIRQTLRSSTSDRTDRLQTALTKLPPRATGLGSFSLLPFLTDRPELYSLHYAWRGTRQFSDQPFPFPDSLAYAILDTQDLVALFLQFDTGEKKSTQATADRSVRLHQFLTSRGLAPSFILHDQVIWTPGGSETLFTTSSALNKKFESIGQDYQTVAPVQVDRTSLHSQQRSSTLVSFDLTLAHQRPIDRNDHLRWIWTDPRSGQTTEEFFPLAYGLYPTSRWSTDEAVTTSFRLVIPDRFSNSESVELSAQLVTLRGHIGLDSVRSAELIYDAITPTSEIFPIATFRPLTSSTP